MSFQEARGIWPFLRSELTKEAQTRFPYVVRSTLSCAPPSQEGGVRLLHTTPLSKCLVGRLKETNDWSAQVTAGSVRGEMAAVGQMPVGGTGPAFWEGREASLRRWGKGLETDL